jgi:hypothetical protein
MILHHLPPFYHVLNCLIPDSICCEAPLSRCILISYSLLSSWSGLTVAFALLQRGLPFTPAAAPSALPSLASLEFFWLPSHYPPPQPPLSCFISFYFVVLGVWTQGLILPRQVLLFYFLFWLKKCVCTEVNFSDFAYTNLILPSD